MESTNGTTQTVETEVCPPGTTPTGCAVPIERMPPAGCVVVRREVVWLGGGVIVGAVLMYWLLQSLRNSR